jgi:hypothetical protein
MNLTRIMLIGLAVIGVVAWLGGIAWLGWMGVQQTGVPKLTDFDSALLAIGSILATNFGAVLGIEGLNRGGTPLSTAENNWQAATSAQVLALVYAIGLVVATGFVVFDGDRANAAPVLTDLTTTLVGAVVGAISVIANVKR